MADHDLIQEVAAAPKPTKLEDSESAGSEHLAVTKAIRHGRADALGVSAAHHLQRAAGNAAMGSLVAQREESTDAVDNVIQRVPQPDEEEESRGNLGA